MKLLVKNKFINICIIVLSLLFQIIPMYKLFIKGVYNWHIRQPETIEGVIEIIFYIICFSIVNYYFKDKKFILITISLSVFYLYNHGVILPFILSVLYFETLILIGRMIINIFSIKTGISNRKFIYEIVFGICFWIFIALLLSLLKHGTIIELRIMTIILFVISICYSIKKKIFKELFIVRLLKNISKMKKIEKEIIIILLMIILIQFAKSRFAFDYDSIWYGLRPEYVLVGKNSFYDNFQLIQFIHYYAKFMELLYFPLSGFKDYSYIYSLNIYMLLLITIYIYLICDNYKIFGLKRKILLLLIISIPTIANFASTAKTDLITVLFLLFTFDHILLFYRFHYYEYFYMSIFGFLLLTCLKETAFLYIPFLVIIFGSLFILKKKKKFRDLNNKKGVLLLLIMVFLIFLGIHYRTYKLTGYPLYPLLQDIFKKIGFEGKYPFNLRNKGIEGTQLDFFNIKKLYEVFFNPTNLPHIIMAWIGNSILFFFILLFVKLKKIKYNSVILASFFLFFSLIIYIMYFNKAGDGNYFIFPLIISLLIFYKLLIQVYNKDIVKTINIVIICFFIPFQLFYMIVSHSSWAWGTGKINFSLTKNLYGSEMITNSIYEQYDLLDILKYIKENNIRRALGEDNQGGLIINRLPLTIEDLKSSSGSYLGVPSIFENSEMFERYCKFAKIEILILPKDYNTIKDKNIRNFVKNFTQEKEKIYFNSYVIIKINK